MLLMGVLFPEKGEVLIGDARVTKKSLKAIRQRLGLVFQDPDDQLFMTTVYDDVAFGPRNYGLDEEEAAERVARALDMVGAAHLRDRASFKLSGGEKRVVAIASVLSMQPDVLIMDEPTAVLDPKARRRVMNLMNGFEHTKIVTSHDLDMVFDVCQRVIVLKDGQVAADGPAADILTDAGLMEACGLELPLSLQNTARRGRNGGA